MARLTREEALRIAAISPELFNDMCEMLEENTKNTLKHYGVENVDDLPDRPWQALAAKRDLLRSLSKDVR